MRILLVEDNPGDARLVREMLAACSRMPSELAHVERLSDARARLADGGTDVVMLDLGLPDATGLEAVDAVAAAAPAVPIVVLTGREEEVAVEALRRGAQDYLSKQHLEGPLLTRALRYAVERKRFQEAERLLSEAGQALASALDVEETLRRVGELAVRSLADFCVVDLLDEGEARRLHVAHADPARAELAREIRDLPLDRSRPHLLRGVLETRRPLLVSPVTAEILREVSQSAEHLRLLERLEMTSFMAVPLLARDRLLGIVSFVSCGRSYGEDDLALAERLGRLAAMEIDNARLYQRARDAVRARDRVLGVVAHDLRNPLNAIALSAELLLEDVLPPEKRTRQIEVIRRTAAGMDRLIEDLLDVARIESDRLVLRREHRDPAQLVRDAVEVNAALAAARGLTLEPAVEGEPGPVLADRDRTMRVLANLIGNAVKFTPEGGRILVTAAAWDAGVRFSVADTGPGIAEDDLPHLFVPFWQARTAQGGGAGLGLAIARGIVEAHGGRIWAESEPGRGATLHFTLPLAEERRRSAGPAEPALRGAETPNR